MTCENHMKFNILVSTNQVYGNTATPAHSHIVCGFCATRAGLSSCRKDCDAQARAEKFSDLSLG
jgi:hypothetical protein